MPTVLSIQSWVACGNVGNTAALFPLQRLGCETWSLNTVAFSNHTGYGKWRGDAVPAHEIAGLFEGIAELGILSRCDAVLSGYLGEAEAGPVLLDIVARVKQANPKALFACDPVMGDIGPGWYVRAGIPEFYRDQALAAADIITPNRFELEWLTGGRIGTLAEAAAAAATLQRQGPGIVLVTSLELAADRVAVVAAGPDGVWAAETPRLPIEATGCGDAVAALFLGWLLKGKALPEALTATTAAIYGVIEATLRSGGGELALIAAQDELVSPSRSLSLQKLSRYQAMETPTKIAVIIGAGSGIGRASALALFEAGFAVVLAGRRREMLEETAALAGAPPPRTLVVPTDVSDPTAVAALFDAVKEAYGRIDLLFNNAGTSTRGIRFEELTFEQWSNVVAVNLTGSFLCAQHAFRMMKEQQPQGGRIINNGSVSAHVPRRNSTPYVATKHALTGLTRSLSLDGRQYNIACGQIDIGNAATSRNEDTARGRLQATGRVEAEPRMDVEHVARGVVYMATLPLDANVQFMTVMATKMPYIGRG